MKLKQQLTQAELIAATLRNIPQCRHCGRVDYTWYMINGRNEAIECSNCYQWVQFEFEEGT